MNMPLRNSKSVIGLIIADTFFREADLENTFIYQDLVLSVLAQPKQIAYDLQGFNEGQKKFNRLEVSKIINSFEADYLNLLELHLTDQGVRVLTDLETDDVSAHVEMFHHDVLDLNASQDKAKDEGLRMQMEEFFSESRCWGLPEFIRNMVSLHKQGLVDRAYVLDFWGQAEVYIGKPHWAN